MTFPQSDPAQEFIPVIDLTRSFSPLLEDRRAVAMQIRKAARDSGFFYAKNHGIDPRMLERQLKWTRKFFDLPMARKLEIHFDKSSHQRGYEPMSAQASNFSEPDFKEGLYLGREIGPGHPYYGKVRHYYGPNQWPVDLPGFREQMETYLDAVFRLGRHLMRLLALSLEVDEHYFDAMMEEPMCKLRLLHYPPPPASAGISVGAGAHTDWGGLTLLLQDEIGGLEVQNAAGQWSKAVPIPGTFVVNLGDMVLRWTNDLYHSNMHRVVCNTSGRHRYSVPFFLEPDYFARIECLSTCWSADNPPRYPPMTSGEHIDEMYRRTYPG